MDLDDDTTAVDPPTVLLPALALSHAQELLTLLAAVRDGPEPDRAFADVLLSNFAASIPSSDQQKQEVTDSFSWGDEMELHAFLGFMIRMAANLEWRLQMLARHLSKPGAHLEAHGAGGKMLTQAVRCRMKANSQVTQYERDQLEKLLSRTDNLMQRRHAYVHGVRSIGKSNSPELTYEVMRLAKDQEELRLDPHSTDDLRDLIDRLIALSRDLLGWWVQHVEHRQQTGPA